MPLLNLRSGLLAIALGLIAHGSLFSSLASAADERPAYRLGPGDKINVTVYGEPDLSGDHVIGDSGDISLPLVGVTNIAGKSLSEVQKEITAGFSEKYMVNPRVSVDVLNYRPFFILGEVRSPGSYPYIAGMTVVHAIALAGGYTSRGNKKRISVRRANTRDETGQRVGENDAVLPGDVINVPERLF